RAEKGSDQGGGNLQQGCRRLSGHGVREAGEESASAFEKPSLRDFNDEMRLSITKWLILACQALLIFPVAARAGVISHWVIPTRPHAAFDSTPHERTRPVIVGDILY